MSVANVGFVEGAGLAITIVLGLAAIGVSIWLYLKQRSRKGLSKDVQVTRLVSVHGEARDKITIQYEGEQIKQVHLIEVALKNSGNVPIRPEDFERPITIELGDGTPLTVDVADSTPDKLKPEVQSTPRGIELQPLLLNEDDSLKVKILVRDFTGKITFDYRIAGISQLMDGRVQPQRSWSRLFGSTDEVLYRPLAVVSVSIGIFAVLFSVKNIFNDSVSHRPLPGYSSGHSVILPNGTSICASAVRVNSPRKGLVTVIPAGRALSGRIIKPRSKVTIARGYCVAPSER